jgi:uncharacterized surface protein with fasciclin (FAS1) repeats
MKKFSFMFFFLAATVIITSCSDDDPVTPVAKKTIVDVVVNGADFTLLEAAVLHAGIAADLQSPSITVFAPTDAAFKAAGFANEAAIKALDKTVLKGILQYHVLGSLVASSAVATKNNEPITMVSGAKAYITKNAGGVSVNGAKVTSADVKAENGAIIHVIDAILLTETKNIVALAQSNSNLSYLVAAVLRANEGSTKVVDILSGAGPLTVFAPTNDAFKAAGFATIDAIKAAAPNDLAKILTYHVIADRVYSTNLTTGDVTTAGGSKLAVNATEGTLKGTSNTKTTKIIAVNIPASNGVVHLIDSVVLP